jgi:hypothetical protein
MHKKALEKGRIEAGNQVCVFVTFGLRPSTFALQATADRSVECRCARKCLYDIQKKEPRFFNRLLTLIERLSSTT